MNMSVKNLSWQQLAVFVVCLVSAFAAHKYLGATEGMTAGVVAALIAFLMGRPVDGQDKKDGAS